jgi:hypothetical protein
MLATQKGFRAMALRKLPKISSFIAYAATLLAQNSAENIDSGIRHRQQNRLFSPR